ncbi:MAG: hypothetical protein IPJ43_21055 [Saprospiraceae bacterium]|nr:hypothetical protein [Saprospiraceae bacterium]
MVSVLNDNMVLVEKWESLLTDKSGVTDIKSNDSGLGLALRYGWKAKMMLLFLLLHM